MIACSSPLARAHFASSSTARLFAFHRARRLILNIASTTAKNNSTQLHESLHQTPQQRRDVVLCRRLHSPSALIRDAAIRPQVDRRQSHVHPPDRRRIRQLLRPRRGQSLGHHERDQLPSSASLDQRQQLLRLQLRRHQRRPRAQDQLHLHPPTWLQRLGRRRPLPPLHRRRRALQVQRPASSGLALVSGSVSRTTTIRQRYRSRPCQCELDEDSGC